MSIRTQLIATAVGLALAYGAGWVTNGWRKDAALAVVERDQAQGRADAAQASLDQLSADIDTISAAGRRAAAVGPALTAEINKLTGALKNAPPLPAGCRPDAVRVRSLTDSVRAANRAAAGQPPGAAVPADPWPAAEPLRLRRLAGVDAR